MKRMELQEAFFNQWMENQNLLYDMSKLTRIISGMEKEAYTSEEIKQLRVQKDRYIQTILFAEIWKGG